MRVKELPIAYCNKACTRLTGYKREEMIGRNCKFLQQGAVQAVEQGADEERRRASYGGTRAHQPSRWRGAMRAVVAANKLDENATVSRVDVSKAQGPATRAMRLAIATATPRALQARVTPLHLLALACSFVAALSLGLRPCNCSGFDLVLACLRRLRCSISRRTARPFETYSFSTRSTPAKASTCTASEARCSPTAMLANCLQLPCSPTPAASYSLFGLPIRHCWPVCHSLCCSLRRSPRRSPRRSSRRSPRVCHR